MSKQNVTHTQLLSACLGNLFEHYDTALFGFLSVFLAPLMFPKQDPITALILTYAMIPLGMFARPLGALFFGYIGDRYGSQKALHITLGGMSIVSGCIAMIPTYQYIGIAAPILFCIGRLMQNFLASGETMGGAIFLLENSTEKRHDLLSGIYNSTTIGGILVASAGVALLSQCHAIESGWRILYLIGCLTALFGYLLRRQNLRDTLDEPSEIQSDSIPIKVFWTHRYPLLLISIVSGFAYANYTIALIFVNGLIPLVTSVTNEEMIKWNTILLVIDFCALPLFGWVASRISREKIMLSASAATILFGLPLFWSIPYVSFAGLIGIRICIVLLGVAFFAPFHAWAQQLVPRPYRYTIISFGYAVGSQILGGPTAALSLWAYKITGMVHSVTWYWLILAFISSVAIVISMKTRVKEGSHYESL